jgi:DNA polymerase-1
MEGTLWGDFEAAKKVRKYRPNPEPRIPETGWKIKREFPDLSRASAISFDVETYDPELDSHGAGFGRGKGHIIGIALGVDGWSQYYPIRHRVGENHDDPLKVLQYASDQLSRPHQLKIGHNLAYDFGWLTKEDVKIEGDFFDTWIAEKLLTECTSKTNSTSLEGTAKRHVGGHKDSDLLYDWAWEKWGRGQRGPKTERELAMTNLRDVPACLVGLYAESDVDLPLEIAAKQWHMLKEEGLWDVFRMECDLLPLFAHMQIQGCQVDIAEAEKQQQSLGEAIYNLQNEVNHIAGEVLDTAKPRELVRIFNKLGLPVGRTAPSDKYPEGQDSVTKYQLEITHHPISDKIIELKELIKFKKDFIEKAILEGHVGGTIHAQTNPMRAITGRMSCQNPNTQQIPSRSDIGKGIRKCFVPTGQGAWWYSEDYSSVESRMLAHYAVGDGADDLRREYNRDPKTDYHDFTKDMVQRITGLEIERPYIKNINFGLIYGSGIDTLARTMKQLPSFVEELFSTYHLGLPYVKKTMEKLSDGASMLGETRTIMGRRVLFDAYEPRSKNKGHLKLKREAALAEWGRNIQVAGAYKATNYVLQGSAADLMKRALWIALKEGLFDRMGYPMSIVHDEVNFTCDGTQKDAFDRFSEIMQTAIKFKVPITTGIAQGWTWGDCK